MVVEKIVKIEVDEILRPVITFKKKSTNINRDIFSTKLY